MEKYCDNTSVGVVIINESGEVLLLDRARFPFGMAAPAGHIDEHGSPEQAAVNEVFEEVGISLPISDLTLAIDARRIDNKCRRENGDHHVWTVYAATVSSNKLLPSPEETKGAGWYSRRQLRQLASNTKRSAVGLYSGKMIFEPIWMNFLAELDMY